MEKDNEEIKRNSDIYTSRPLGIPKSGFVKNTSHLSIKADPRKNASFYVSKGKNASVPINRKSSYYGNNSKSHLRHSSYRYGLKPKNNFSLSNSPSNPPSELSKVESGQDLNCNISFNNNPTLCNFASSVPDIATFNKFLSFQSNHHYELAIAKSVKYKQRNLLPEQRTFSTAPNRSFMSNKFFSLAHSSNLHYQCSKNYSPKACYATPPDRPPYKNNALLNEKYPSRCNAKFNTPPETGLNEETIKFIDLPIFANSNYIKDPTLSCKASCCEDPLQAKKQRNYYSKKWDSVTSASEFRGGVQTDDGNKMLFPALPNSSHSQLRKIISTCNNMSSSDPSSVENFDSKSLHSVTGRSIASTSSAEFTNTLSSNSQASYADVIRMPSTYNSVHGYTASIRDKTGLDRNLSTPTTAKLKQDEIKENFKSGTPDYIFSRLSLLDVNVPNSKVTVSCNQQIDQTFVTSCPIVVSLEKPSFFNSSLQTCKHDLSAPSANFPLSDKNAENVMNEYTSSMEYSFPTNRSSVSSEFTSSMTDANIASIKTDSVYSSPSSISSIGEVFKPTDNADSNIRNFCKQDSPVIIMSNYPHSNMPEISFGIDHEEMLKLCSDKSSIYENVLNVSENTTKEIVSEKNKTDYSFEFPSLKTENTSSSVKGEIEITSKKIITVNGKNFCWEDVDVAYNQNSYLQLTGYFAKEWEDIENELKKSSTCTNGTFIMQ